MSVGLLGDDYAVAVGVPGEALGRLTGAGTVDVFTPAASGGGLTDTAAHSQDTAGVPGNDETADHLGQQVAIVAGELCAGVPGEDLGTVRDAGRVLCTASVDGRGRPAAPWLSIQQGGSGATSLGGSPTAGAAVGAAVSRIAADREGDTFFYGERPVIGAPGATVSGQAAAGQVFGPPPIIDRAGPVAGERYGVPATAVSNGPELRD